MQPLNMSAGADLVFATVVETLPGHFHRSTARKSACDSSLTLAGCHVPFPSIHSSKAGKQEHRQLKQAALRPSAFQTSQPTMEGHSPLGAVALFRLAFRTIHLFK